MYGRSEVTWGPAFSVWCLALLLGIAGCSAVGPTLLRNGRASYNDAISSTNDEQILETIVRGRYAENTGLLTVASVTASVRVAGSSSADFGIGPDSNFAGNLVPLQVGALYEESPTITYVPVQGEKYLSRLLAPLPLELTLLLISAVDASDLAFTLLIKGINGVRNDAFLASSAQRDARFGRIGHLLTELHRAGKMTWLHDGETRASRALFTDFVPSHKEEVAELLSLLGLKSSADGAEIIVPVVLSVGRATNGIRIEPRSLNELLMIAEAAVDVAEEDVQSGAAKLYPPLGVALRGIRIHRSSAAPVDAAVAVERKGWWYFIGGQDLATKRYFRLIEVLMSVLMSETSNQNVPILTLPVSR